jgi:hypothetical protein
MLLDSARRVGRIVIKDTLRAAILPSGDSDLTDRQDRLSGYRQAPRSAGDRTDLLLPNL